MFRFLLLAILTSNTLFLIPSASQAQSSAPKTAETRLFSYLDQNRNSVIDPEEFKNVPLPMKVWLAENGIEFTKPLAQSQFLKVAPQMMQAIREGRHAGREKIPSRRVSLVVLSKKTVLPSTTSISSTSSAGSSDFGSFAPTLPSSYSEGDIDGDGQIGMYEWRKWKKSALSEFLKLDRNNDGFLTPREIQLASSGSSSGTASAGTSSTTASTSRRSSSPSSTTTPTPAVVLPTKSADEHKTAAEKLFAYIDTNKNGTIEKLELLIRGRTSAKPVLEKAKVDLTKPLTKDQFVNGYVKGKAAAE